MNKELSNYSAEDKKRIAKTAKRNIYSECTLILTAGFTVLMFAMLYVRSITFLPISEAIGLRPTVVWVVLSFGIAACWARCHLIWFQPKISKARDLDAAFLYQYQDELRRQNEAKYHDVQSDK